MTLPQLRPSGRVMVIEDEPRMRDLLVRAITQWGFVVTSARSGEEAQRLAPSLSPEIVLLDLNLPGIDGLQCFEKLRGMFPALQAIVLTGFASIESARQAVHLDVVEFLTKPAHLGEIEQALDRAMKRLMSTTVEVTPAEPLPKPPAAPDQTLEELERDHILSVLEKNEGNRTAAATALGISRRTLYYKLEEYQRQGYQID